MSANATIVEAWNTVLFDKFFRFRHLIIDSLAVHSREALARHVPETGARVLDVGCGFGDATLDIAQWVGPSGRAVGVDCAPRFVELCEREAAAAGAKNASFFVADVQSGDLRGPYDRVFSRFGTMFFVMPGAALRNIRRAMAPGAEMTMIVWRKREDNAWVHDAELRVREIVPVVSHEDTDEVHCGPGPFSMASADLVSSILAGAGFDRIAFERFDVPICIGRDLNEAVEFAMALGPAGEIIRLAGDDGARLRQQVAVALADTLARFARPDGEIWGPSSAWFVSARNPPQ
jgi:ubiquinone/menaquinone biosynthesis C-methylase UbiE